MSAAGKERKTAIVTGAGQGIGFEICRLLSEKGMAVLLNDVDEALAKKSAATISGTYGPCYGIGGDAADPGFIDEMISTALREFGRLDIVIANAGITLFGGFLDYTREAFQDVMNTNLGGSFFLAQAAARQMIRQGGGGRILFMSSVTAHQAHKNLAAYSMTKAALEMLARNLVIELSAYGITVNAIAPGATLTERTAEDDRYEQTWSDITPMGRPARTTDIAQAAYFLVSELAGHITGQTLVIDGGWTAVSPSPYER